MRSSRHVTFSDTLQIRAIPCFGKGRKVVRSKKKRKANKNYEKKSLRIGMTSHICMPNDTEISSGSHHSILPLDTLNTSPCVESLPSPSILFTGETFDSVEEINDSRSKRPRTMWECKTALPSPSRHNSRQQSFSEGPESIECPWLISEDVSCGIEVISPIRSPKTGASFLRHSSGSEEESIARLLVSMQH